MDGVKYFHFVNNTEPRNMKWPVSHSHSQYAQVPNFFLFAWMFFYFHFKRTLNFLFLFLFHFFVDTITNVPISPHFALNIIFQLQFTFNIISYWFQAHSIVGTQSHTSQCSPRRFQCPPGPVHSCYNVIDYIPYALLYISVTLVYPPICTL